MNASRGGVEIDRLGGAENCPYRGKGGVKRLVGESVGDDRERKSEENVAESELF